MQSQTTNPCSSSTEDIEKNLEKQTSNFCNDSNRSKEMTQGSCKGNQIRNNITAKNRNEKHNKRFGEHIQRAHQYIRYRSIEKVMETLN